MANKDDLEAIREGTEHWNNYRINIEHIPDLTDADLNGLQLDSANLQKVDFTRANLTRTNLREADLTLALLQNANLEGARLPNAIMLKTNLTGAILTNAHLPQASLKKAILIESVVKGASLEGANLHSADINNAKLYGAKLTNADLQFADLRGCAVDSATNINTTKTKECRIDRHVLDSLADIHKPGIADLRKMKIEDPVALLRAAYGGFWQWLHLLAIMLFVAPYVWFLVSHWTVSSFSQDKNVPTLALWECLLHYIYSGGMYWSRWHLNLWPFIAFMVSVSYNGLRLFMLWKTKTLELQQQVSGLPALYPLSGYRLWLYGGAKWGLWLNLIAVGYHSLHFLSRRIPIVVGA